MSPFACTHCGHAVYFENSDCGQCGAVLGFVPAERRMVAFALPGPAPLDTGRAAAGWQRLGPAAVASGPPETQRLQPCDNRQRHQVCNWMLDAADPGPRCISCRLTRVIPSLGNVDNVDNGRNLSHWAAIERAKRYLVHTLIGLGLTPQPIGTDPAARGLCFDLLESLPGEPAVMTGHDEGVITLNIAEADGLYREATRLAMGEPVRSLLGDLRHEVSHYLAWRHVQGRSAIARCREGFGDERQNYPAALQAHYGQGAPADWPARFVSAYASAHPCEDWAETCAQYLLVVDALETASAWGLQLGGPSPTRAPAAPDAAEPVAQRVLAQWLPLAQFLNAMNRSLGQPDGYPFLLPPAVLAKMSLVQTLLAEATAREAAAAVAPPPGASRDPALAPASA